MSALLITFVICVFPIQESQSEQGSIPNDPEIQQRLQEMVDKSIEAADKETKLDGSKDPMSFDIPIPAIIAGYQKHGEPIRIGAAGVRKLESDELVTPNDLVHIGSCTKAMTATLIGRLIDRGELSFETTIKEGLPHLAQKIHKDYHDITVHQLLTHRSGLPREAFWRDNPKSKITKQRNKIVIKALADKPKSPLDDSFAYSNLGYCIAGMIAAKTQNTSWEKLIKRELFDVLDMKSASFGPPGTKGKIDQPWGHAPLGKVLLPRQGDNPFVLGPAGTVHLTIADWAKFALAHAGCSDPPIVSEETMKILHEVVKQNDEDENNYACGWMVLQRPLLQGTALCHNGSNTMWFATIWVAPKNEAAYFAAINAGLNHGITKAADDAIGVVIEAHKKAYMENKRGESE